MGECYVCTEECYTLSPCNCTNAYLHEDCYAKLIACKYKKCTMCLADFPVPEPVHIEEADDIYIGLDEDEINIVWWLTPILMRPHPHTSFNDCDVIIDFPRNILWVVSYMLLFHSLDYPDDPLINIFSTKSTTEWFYSIILHLMICVIIRHWCRIKTRPPPLQ